MQERATDPLDSGTTWPSHLSCNSKSPPWAEHGSHGLENTLTYNNLTLSFPLLLLKEAPYSAEHLLFHLRWMNYQALGTLSGMGEHGGG